MPRDYGPYPPMYRPDRVGKNPPFADSRLAFTILELILRSSGGWLLVRKSLLNNLSGYLVAEPNNDSVRIETVDLWEGRWNPLPAPSQILTAQDMEGFAHRLYRAGLYGRGGSIDVPKELPVSRAAVIACLDELITRAEALRREEEDLAEQARLEQEAAREKATPKATPKPPRVPRRGIQRG